ncbi:MAG: preprotein translocase subunit SecY [Beduini sp.]|uniref:preprotein translocase subunit SecY n=1 Tax=Beduini sp. TaxID=1922300 RepID=UPI0039A106FB
MFTFLKKIFQKGELRHKIIFTLGMLFVFRIGSAVTIPAINSAKLSSGLETTGILAIMNMLGGGSLERFSLFSLGVSPYITASIIIELLSMDVIPTLTQWRDEGETGRKKKDRVTRYVTVILAAVQAFSLTYAFDKSYGILRESTPLSYAYVVIIMVAGAMFAMWMGDQITNKGIGNGVSLLIFTGIVSNLPTSFITVFNTLVVTNQGTQKLVMGALNYGLFVLLYLLIVVFVVYNEGANRKIPIVYATNSNPMMRTKDGTHMPIKINTSGVIPVIFASSVLATPLTVSQLIGNTNVSNMIQKICTYNQPVQYPIGFVLYLVLIVAFSFFYANLQIDAEKISGDLRKNGGSIPGVRSGIETQNYIKKVLNRVTVVGSIFLLIVAVIPIMIPVIWKTVANSAVTLYGTGLIIVTGVALETVNQIKTHLTRKEYRGYIRR